MAITLITDPAGQIAPGERLTVSASGFIKAALNTIVVTADGIECSCVGGTATGEGVTSLIATFLIPSTARSEVVVTAKSGAMMTETTTLSIISSHTVTMFVYIDGSYSGSFEDSVDDGGSFDIQNFVESSISSQRRLDYIIYNSQKYTSYFIIYNIYSDISLDIYLKKRPSSWSWTSTIASGYEIKISASEWNSFTSRINSFRTYVGASSYSFTTVSSGTDMTPTICNQARSAINDIASYQSSYSVPSALTAGNYYASFFNGLKNVLNAIQ